MAKLYDVTVVNGKYTKDGVEKNNYQKIGSIIETKNGKQLKLDSIPVIEGGWNGWAYLNTPKAKDGFPRDDGFPKDDDLDSIPF
jgi:hypothetical protein